jgi:hypothetical protein
MTLKTMDLPNKILPTKKVVTQSLLPTIMAAQPPRANGDVITKHVGRDQRVNNGKPPPMGAPTINPTQSKLPKNVYL